MASHIHGLTFNLQSHMNDITDCLWTYSIFHFGILCFNCEYIELLPIALVPCGN